MIDQWNKTTKERIQAETLLDGYTLKVPKWEAYEEFFDDLDAWAVNEDKKLQAEKDTEIDSWFESCFSDGHFFSTALNEEVDCRRTGLKNDMQNVDALISFMQRNETTETYYVAYNTTLQGVTVPQLQQLKTEMEDYGLMIYQKKHLLKNQLKSAKTVEAIEAVII